MKPGTLPTAEAMWESICWAPANMFSFSWFAAHIIYSVVVGIKYSASSHTTFIHSVSSGVGGAISTVSPQYVKLTGSIGCCLLVSHMPFSFSIEIC